MFFVQFFRGSDYSRVLPDPRLLVSSLSPHVEPDKCGFLRKERALLVQCVNFTSAASKLEPAPFYHAESGIVVVAWSRLDNRLDLLSLLDISAIHLELICDTELIFHAWMKWGEQCVEYLVGDFSFALYLSKEQKIFCARDHMGVRPLFYSLHDNQFICSTSLPPLLAEQLTPVSIEDGWIVEYLSGLSKDFIRTPYKDIFKLAPAHCLTVTLNEHHLKQYFHLGEQTPLLLKDSREYVDVYREQLDQAVKCRLRSQYPVGCELSGGIDSSTVTAFAAKHMGSNLSDLHAFSIARQELEPRFIVEVSAASQIPHTHVFAPTQISEQLHQRSTKILGYPAEQYNAICHEQFYCLAEQLGIRSLLSGFGGDEFVTTRQGALILRGLAASGQYAELFKRLAGNPLRRFLRLTKLVLAKDTRAEYTPVLYEAFKQRWPHQIVRKELVDQYDLKQRYFDKARFNTCYNDLYKFILEKQWQPYMPIRMENCLLMAASRKIEYAWPLLDIRLIKLFMSIPPQEHYYRGIGRYLHRQAIVDTVPNLITWNQNKDMGDSIGYSNMMANLFKSFNTEDIHPALANMINVDKLSKQIRAYSNINSSAGTTNFMVQATQNINAVVQVDLWLKQLSAP